MQFSLLQTKPMSRSGPMRCAPGGGEGRRRRPCCRRRPHPLFGLLPMCAAQPRAEGCPCARNGGLGSPQQAARKGRESEWETGGTAAQRGRRAALCAPQISVRRAWRGQASAASPTRRDAASDSLAQRPTRWRPRRDVTRRPTRWRSARPACRDARRAGRASRAVPGMTRPVFEWMLDGMFDVFVEHREK